MSFTSDQNLPLSVLVMWCILYHNISEISSKKVLISFFFGWTGVGLSLLQPEVTPPLLEGKKKPAQLSKKLQSNIRPTCLKSKRSLPFSKGICLSQVMLIKQ